jgi:hypothetical protein
MTTLIERDSALENFFMCAFHQDWADAYGSTPRAVEDYLSRARPEQVQALLVELKAFRATSAGDEREIEAELEPICDYVIGYEPSIQSWNEWLDWIERLLEVKLAPRT